jgi:hypothetical protein
MSPLLKEFHSRTISRRGRKVATDRASARKKVSKHLLSDLFNAGVSALAEVTNSTGGGCRKSTSAIAQDKPVNT